MVKSHINPMAPEGFPWRTGEPNRQRHGEHRGLAALQGQQASRRARGAAEAWYPTRGFPLTGWCPPSYKPW